MTAEESPGTGPRPQPAEAVGRKGVLPFLGGGAWAPCSRRDGRSPHYGLASSPGALSLTSPLHP